jgi:hypothetical protein
MPHEHLSNLRLDRRLLRRRGWIAEKELERELTKLPDAAEKAQPVEGEPAPAAPEGPGR